MRKEKTPSRKLTIWYARTYRKLNIDYTSSILFVLILIVPSLLLLIFNIAPITRGMTKLAQSVLSGALPESTFTVETTQYVPFGTMYILGFDCPLPTAGEIAINLLVVVGVIAILALTKLRGRPLVIYLTFSVMIHVISCVFFSFVRDTTIYSGMDFSNIILKQQISVWILFIILMGVVLAFFGNLGLGHKILAFFSLMLYSGAIGILRYIVFVFVLTYFSALYMADMYFIMGPIFDFLYLVGIYAIYSSRMQKVFDSPEGEGEWRWL